MFERLGRIGSRPAIALRTATLVAVLALAACNNEPEVISTSAPDPQAAALAAAAPVELPPAIEASRTYRCADNSLLYAEFFTDETVRVRLGERSAAPTLLAAAEAGSPYMGDDYSVSANADTIDFTAPGKGTQSCHA